MLNTTATQHSLLKSAHLLSLCPPVTGNHSFWDAPPYLWNQL